MGEVDSHDTGTELMLTIRDASRATGLSIKAIRRRIERGTLSARMVDGRRRVPMGELLQAGLLVTRPDGRRVEVEVAREALDTLTSRVAALEARVAELESGRGDGTPARAKGLVGTSSVAAIGRSAPV